MPARRFRIKLLLPLLIIGVFLPAGFAITSIDYLQRKNELTDKALSSARSDTALLAIRLESHLRINDIDGAIRMLSIESARNDVNFLLVVGTKGRVLLSSRYEWVGKNIADIDRKIAAELPSSSGQPHALLAGHKQVQTRQTIDLLTNGNTPAIYKKITLVGEYSYAGELDQFKDRFYFHAAVLGGLLLLLAALIYWILRAWVGRPFDQLKAYLANLSAFRFERPEIGGSLEIHELADSLTETTRRLVGSEQSLGKTSAILQSLLNSIPDLIHYKDVDGRYLGANDPYLHFMGLREPSDLIGKRPSELMPEQGVRLEAEDRQVFSSGTAMRSEEWFADSHGIRLLFETVKVPFTDPAGTVIGTIGISRNITERRLMEEQLAHAQKLEALGTLVAGIAHNFNNILAGILGQTYLAHSAAVSKETIQHLDDIDRLGGRAVELVRQLMTFARKDPVETSDINFSILCKESLKTLQFGMDESIRFTAEVTDEDIHVIGAPSLLQQVIFNLINNAKDAVLETDGDREIEVLLERCSRPDSAPENNLAKEWCCLSVWDNGNGISEANQEKVFEPFFTTKEPGSGTGLGLASALGTIASLQGSIELDSALETGTEFRIYLPVTAGEQVATEGIRNMEIPKASRTFNLLIVDDEIALSQTLQQVLTKLGYHAITASNGQEGIALFNSTDNIDLVISDLAMPVMGGETMMRRLWATHPELPVIFITGYAHNLQDIPELQRTICRLMHKPLRIPDLILAIRETLEKN